MTESERPNDGIVSDGSHDEASLGGAKEEGRHWKPLWETNYSMECQAWEVLKPVDVCSILTLV